MSHPDAFPQSDIQTHTTSDVVPALISYDAHDYDPHTPRTSHPMLAAGQFLDFFSENEGQILNIAAGGTNLQRDLRLHHVFADVVSLDPSYTTSDFEMSGHKKVPGIAQELPFPDNTFSTTLMHFGLQHIKGGPTQMSAAIMEAIRVTRPTVSSSVTDNRSGTVLLGPVFDVDHLKELMLENGLQKVSGIQAASGSVRRMPHALPTLVIKKVPALDPSMTIRLAEVVASSGAMKPRHKEVGEHISRLFHGRSHV